MSQNDIMVSIICNSYNHEKYIRDALEGFVNQKTDFQYEVLIHDDASTDNTQEIIREYEKKYPTIIKPIYQKDNQYSQGVWITETFQEPRVQGKYIAFCEGDDYWIDPLKLQKQIDALERHPEINICATAAKVESEVRWSGYKAKSDVETIFSVEEVISGGGSFVATPSLVYRSFLISDPPEFRKMLCTDYSLQIYGSLKNGMLFLPDETTVYRYMTQQSWTRRMASNKQKKIRNLTRVENMLQCLDKETGLLYHDAIEKKRQRNSFELLLLKEDFKTLVSREYRDIFIQQSKKRKLKIIISLFISNIKTLLKKV